MVIVRFVTFDEDLLKPALRGHFFVENMSFPGMFDIFGIVLFNVIILLLDLISINIVSGHEMLII